MQNESAPIDQGLLAAYRDTDYRIDAELPVIARIAERSAALDALLDAHGVAAAAFLTAWNPRSRETREAENRRAQDRLRAQAAAMGCGAIPGAGVGRGGDWPPEPSLLILGIARAQAEALARLYAQNAWVWIARGAAPELVLTALDAEP